MITCPACGKENEDSAYECKRCRAPLRDEVPEEQPAEEAAPAAPQSSESLGEVCRRCEAYNEPGVRVCTNCGLELFAEPAPEEPVMAATPPAEPEPESADANPSITSEMRALALSDDEAAEAGLAHGNGAPELPMDRTPPDAYSPQHEEPPPPPPAVARPVATAGGGVGIAARRAPEPPPAKAPEPAAPAEKPCANCGAMNPPAAKFCFDCGTPFAKKPAPPPEPPPTPKVEPVKRPSIEISPSIQIDADLAEAESTAESAPVSLDEPLPEEQPAEEPLAEEIAAEEPVAAESVAEPIEEEPPPPFQASLIVEKGGSQGTAFALAHLENKIGSNGAQIELGEDPFVAPHAATIAFADDHLVVRDEGSANGVFVKVRESAPLEPGDFFAAGERLFRYDGPTELPKNGQGDTPFLGAPRPQGRTVRVTEMLAGGKTGRTCHRSGPIAIGRTGCDMNFPSDQLLAARHAEIRIAEDGSATLVDLGAGPSGVFIRVRSQAQHDLQAGDVLQVGEQLLRVEVG